MTNTEAQQAAVRLAQEARRVAADLRFDERADLVRELVKAIRDAVKFDAVVGGAPGGREWELEALGRVAGAAEDYYFDALKEEQAHRG